MHVWQLQDAKNRLGQLVRDAAAKGPQVITRHGREAAIVLSPEDYRALTCPKTTLVEFLRTSPLAGLELDAERPDECAEVLDLWS